MEGLESSLQVKDLSVFGESADGRFWIFTDITFARFLTCSMVGDRSCLELFKTKLGFLKGEDRKCGELRSPQIWCVQ